MDKKDIYGVATFSDEEARNYISLLFDGYEMRKKKKDYTLMMGVQKL